MDVCPAKEKALVMRPLEEQMPQQKNWEYITRNIGYKQVVDKTKSVKNLQFAQPLFEFSGACAGCGETAYIKAISQLFGDKIRQRHGLHLDLGGTVDPLLHQRQGAGAGLGSLFEDNAELWVCTSASRLRDRIGPMEEAIAFVRNAPR